MVCPNCSSTDIITVQDQRFCISCGQILSDIKPAAAPSKPVAASSKLTAIPPKSTTLVESNVTISANPAAKRRKPGRPKAGRLDAPQPEAVLPETNPPASSDIVVPVAATAPRIARSTGRRLSDIATTKPRATPATKPAPDSKVIAKPIPLRSEPLPYGTIESASLHERFRLRTIVWTIWPAVLLAVVAGAIAYLLAGDQPGQAWTATQQAGWPVWGELILVLLLFYVGRNIGSAAIAYGIARRADHRPLQPAHQLSASLNSFLSRLGFDAMMTLLQATAAALIITLVIIGGANWPVPELVQVIALFIAYLILGYLLTGLGLTQGLGHVALTLGNLSIWQAFTLGWNFFRRHFEMVGFKILSLIVELLLALPLFAAVVALVLYLPPELTWFAALSAIILTTTGGALVGAGTAVWWQAAYRALVHRSRPQQAHKLLSGRQPQPTQQGAAVAVAVIITILAGLASIWPWVTIG